MPKWPRSWERPYTSLKEDPSKDAEPSLGAPSRVLRPMLAAADAALVPVLVGMLRLYRALVSPLIGPACRFHPSCSVYAGQAIARLGVLRGAGLALGRLLRCHPWHPGGFDPVPKAGGGVARGFEQKGPSR
jgi:hypothetical protein